MTLTLSFVFFRRFVRCGCRAVVPDGLRSVFGVIGFMFSLLSLDQVSKMALQGMVRYFSELKVGISECWEIV